MPLQIALLRAVNLGPHGKVAMADLRKLFEDEGLTDVQTVVNSGNVVFSSTKKPAAREQQLEQAAERELGLSTDFYVRTASEWAAIVKRNPFTKEAKENPTMLVLMVCGDKVPASVKVTGAKREVVKPSGREIFITYPDGQGRSKLKVDARGTARNWNTVLKLLELTKV